MPRIVFMLLFCGLLPGACATAPDDQAEVPEMDAVLLELTHQDGRACFYTSDIAGFGSMSDEAVSVSTRMHGEYYLVTTVFRCPALRTAFGIGFQGTGPEICGGGGSNLVSEGSTCPVGYVFEFASREDAHATWEMAKARREVLERYHVPK